MMGNRVRLHCHFCHQFLIRQFEPRNFSLRLEHGLLAGSANGPTALDVGPVSVETLTLLAQFQALIQNSPTFSIPLLYCGDQA